jgi:hypothetical protein
MKRLLFTDATCARRARAAGGFALVVGKAWRDAAMGAVNRIRAESHKEPGDSSKADSREVPGRLSPLGSSLPTVAAAISPERMAP